MIRSTDAPARTAEDAGKTHTNTIGTADLLPRATEAGALSRAPANSRPVADHHAGRAFYSSAGAASVRHTRADSPGERHGTVAHRKRTHCLTEAQRREMVRMWRNGASSSVVAAQFGVHEAYVRKAGARAGIRKRELRA